MTTADPEDSRPALRRFLKLEDVAGLLATTPAQVYALVRRGELPAIKLGGRGQWRVEDAALEQFIQQQYEQTRAWVTGHPFTEGRAQEGEGCGGADENGGTPGK